MTTQIWIGDCREVLKQFQENSVHMVCCSPPYLGLRDYGTGRWEGGQPGCDHAPYRGVQGNGDRADRAFTGASPQRDHCRKCGATRVDQQIGLESDHHEFVRQMVITFREVRRVLRADGVCWLNIGDSYSNDTKWGGATGGKHAKGNHGETLIGRGRKYTGLKEKELVGAPWRVALALQDDGWYLRQDIIWNKPNPMPESVNDRCTKAHEYIFMLTKSADYYFDNVAIEEPALFAPGCGWDEQPKGAFAGQREDADNVKVEQAFRAIRSTRNKRSVWTVASEPFPEAHFATFPPSLIEPCVLASTSARGCCPSCGTGWLRITAPSERYAAVLGSSFHDHEADLAAGMAQMRGTDGANRINNAGIYSKEIETLGWYPGCKCYKVAALPKYPPYPRKKACKDEAEYQRLLDERRTACRQVDRVRSVMCQEVTQLESTPALVLDPFGGAGTSALVSDRHQRDSIIVELNPKYAEMARRRLEGEGGLFSKVVIKTFSSFQAAAE